MAASTSWSVLRPSRRAQTGPTPSAIPLKPIEPLKPVEPEVSTPSASFIAETAGHRISTTQCSRWSCAGVGRLPGGDGPRPLGGDHPDDLAGLDPVPPA